MLKTIRNLLRLVSLPRHSGNRGTQIGPRGQWRFSRPPGAWFAAFRRGGGPLSCAEFEATTGIKCATHPDFGADPAHVHLGASRGLRYGRRTA